MNDDDIIFGWEGKIVVWIEEDIGQQSSEEIDFIMVIVFL